MCEINTPNTIMACKQRDDVRKWIHGSLKLRNYYIQHDMTQKQYSNYSIIAHSTQDTIHFDNIQEEL